MYRQRSDECQHLRRASALNPEIQRLPRQVEAVPHAPHLFVMLRAPDAAGGQGRGSEMLPHLIRHPYQLLSRLRREAPANPAGTAELRPGEIPDLLPPVRGFLRFLFHGPLPRADDLQNPLLRGGSENPVRFQSVPRLECPGRLPGQPPPDPVHLPAVVPKIPQQVLILFYSHCIHLTRAILLLQ